MNMDYPSACAKVGFEGCRSFSSRFQKPTIFIPPNAKPPSLLWKDQAAKFSSFSAKQLNSNKEGKEQLRERGLSDESIENFVLGWNPSDTFIPFPQWGLLPEKNEKGREKKIWLPKGIVIPSMEGPEVIKLKIRRADWHEGDTLPKYVEVSGSQKSPSIFGTTHCEVALILESELDAILVQQLAGELCYCISIGGAGKRPDLTVDALLKASSSLLFALDFDDAGKAAYRFWHKNYRNMIFPWPISRGKSPGDAFKLGVDLRKWVAEGIRGSRNQNKGF